MAAYPKPLQSWTDERVEQLRSLWDGGLSMAQIARQLSVTRSSVCAKSDRLGLRRGAPTEAATRKYSRPFNPMYTEKSPPTSPEPEVTDPLLINGKPVTIRTCTDRTCRWPLSEASADMVMCGREPEKGKPYCPTHAAKVYQPQHDQRRRHIQAEKAADAVG